MNIYPYTKEEILQTIKEEGFDYTFDGYSNWDEYEDETFHKLRQAFLSAKKDLKDYLNQ